MPCVGPKRMKPEALATGTAGKERQEDKNAGVINQLITINLSSTLTAARSRPRNDGELPAKPARPTAKLANWIVIAGS